MQQSTAMERREEMSGFLGAIEGLVGEMGAGTTGGGGNFLSELMNVLEAGMSQSSSNASGSSSASGSSASGSSNAGGSSSTGSEIAQIAGEVVPIVAAFL